MKPRKSPLASAFLIAAFLALSLIVPAPASAQNVWPASWFISTPTGINRGYFSCQSALDEAIELYRTFWSDPLVLNSNVCTGAVQTSPSPVNYRIGFKLTTSPPTSPQQDIDFAPTCTDALLSFDAARGWICTASSGSAPFGRNGGYCPTCVANPLQPGYGNKFLTEVDYAGQGPFPLRLERFHNSARGIGLYNRSGLNDPTGTSGNWKHNYERRLVAGGPTQGNNPLAPATSFNVASVTRPDGKEYAFALVSGVWTPDVDLRGERLEKISTGWKLTTSEDEVELYDQLGRLVSIANRAGVAQTLAYITTGTNNGLLQTVTDHFGRTLTFNYTNQRLSSVTIPGGGQISYGYGTDVHKFLLTVTYPDTRTRTYHYENPVSGGYIRMLTGITDELGVRYATWGYDTNISSPSQGKPTLSQHAGGADKVTISYSGTSALVSTFVTASTSSTRTYTFQNNFGVLGVTGISGPACPQCGDAETGYNGTIGLVSRGMDWNNFRWNRGFDLARNLETARNVARDVSFALTPEAIQTVTTWHSVFRLPTIYAEPLRTTTNAYDPDGTQCGARGALCSKSVQATNTADGFTVGTPIGAPRAWAYTYNANGQVLTANGPRTDVTDTTTYTYYANNDADLGKRGNVATITNALNQTTQITAYNAHGQPLTIVDPNGLTTTLAYDARQRLTSRNVGGETTTYDYDFAGQLTKVTMPDGAFLSYSYDPAHRLTDIQDNLGNKITYTLDVAGNRTKEEVFDPLSALQQTRSRVYSSLNRLFQELGALKQTTEYTYDGQGNVLTVKDPLNRTTTNVYDPRERLKQVTDPAKGVVAYTYNGLSALTSVKDPRNLTTTYALNGHGDLNTQVSPDAGTTGSTFDLAGNLVTQTDAKNQVTTYAYDALNRVNLITFHDGSKQTYAYDAGTNGLGRLSSITETNPSMVTTSVIAYGYDLHGRVTSEARTVNGITYTTGYSYTNGQLSGVSYPSGRTLTYSLDSVGRINQVTTSTGSTQVVVENVAYHPFGGAKSWTFGNSQTYARTVDQDGRIASYTLGGTGVTVGFDTASRITGITPNTYGYDSLDRLTSATLPGTSYGYSYDAVGNRLTKTVGANSDTYTYSATSNRIATLTPFGSPLRTFTLDANGSTTSDAVNAFVYDTRGRMVQSTNAASLVTTYQVNALGQRIRKTNSNEDTVFIYDSAGRLIAENDASGTLKREFIYLGDIPVGVVQGGALAFIHPDHLNTPRQVFDAAQQLRWKWEQAEPFGVTIPNEDPNSVGSFELPLRFSGQYSDKETNLNYNAFRDYDPRLGRYVESDPIGVNGGFNTYGYVAGAPLSAVDPSGLVCISVGNRTTCSIPNGPTFIVPTPSNFPQFLGPSSSSFFHDYKVARPIGCADPNAVMQALINNPTPGDPRPATPNGTPNNARVPGIPFNNFVTTYLTKDVVTGYPVVVNIAGTTGRFGTQGLFGPGFVARYVKYNIAVTAGQGTALSQWGPDLLQDWATQSVWGEQMERLIRGSGCSCRQ